QPLWQAASFELSGSAEDNGGRSSATPTSVHGRGPIRARRARPSISLAGFAQKSYRKKAVAELLIGKQCNTSGSAICFQKIRAQKRSGRCRPAPPSERLPSLWGEAPAPVCSH